MKRLLTLISILAIIQTIGTSAGAGHKLDQAVLTLEADIKKASSQLTGIRKQHSAERIMLSRRIAELENKIIPLREKRQGLKDIIWMKETGYQQLQARAGSLKEEVNFCASLLSEYYREMTARMTLAEENHLKESRQEIDLVLEAESSEAVLEGIQSMLDMIGNQNQVNLGGTVFKGQALDKNGLLYSGTFIQAGPIDFFVDDKGERAGLTGLNLGSAIPQIILGLNAANLQELALGREAEVLLDFTLGEAIKVKQHKKSWFQHIRAGGIVMIPILGLGLLCLGVAIRKFIELRKLKTHVEPVIANVLAFIHRGDIQQAGNEARKAGAPIAPVLAEGVHHYNAPQEHIEEIMHEQILSQIPALEKNLPVLAVSAAVLPLLGLLGTVTGMVHTFDLMAIFGTGKVNLLSGGISEALITTEFGLITAIPALLVHAYLSKRVKTVVHTMEQTAIAFVNGLHIRKKK